MLHLTHVPTGENMLLFVELKYRSGCYVASVNEGELPDWVDADIVDAFLEMEAIYGGGRHLEDDVRLVLLPGLDRINRTVESEPAFAPKILMAV